VQFQHGGTCGNTSAVLAKLGEHPYFVTELCPDPIGRYLRSSLEALGVDFSWSKETPGKANMLCIAVIEEDRERTIFPWLPPGSDYPSFTEDNLSLIPEDEPLLAFTGGMVMTNDPVTMDAVCAKAERLKQAGSTIVFDLNVRSETYGMGAERRNAYMRMIESTDILIGSGVEEFAALTGEATMERAVTRLLAPGRTIIARDGRKPVKVYRDGTVTAVPAEAVFVLQTLGAGDTFNGAFLSAYNRGLSVEQAVRFANQIAGYMVSTPGHLAVPADYEQRLAQCAETR
jgi:sugar/nucleoside kinase (ribokinase family)